MEIYVINGITVEYLEWSINIVHFSIKEKRLVVGTLIKALGGSMQLYQENKIGLVVFPFRPRGNKF